MKLGLLPGLLAVFAAVLAEGTALFDLTLAAGVGAFERVGHGSPRGQLYASISATARSGSTVSQLWRDYLAASTLVMVTVVPETSPVIFSGSPARRIRPGNFWFAIW